jgi:parvulin-like peptidyl-prolyl isomerase
VKPRILIICFIIYNLFAFPINAEDAAIVVNGDTISRDDYNYALTKYEESYKRYFGAEIDETNREKMKKELIDDLINRQLYIQEARRRGITAKTFAPEEEIEELMMSWQDATSESKSARDKAEQTITNNKIREILPSKVIASLQEDITVNDGEVLDEYFRRAEKMRVRYIKVDPYAIANNLDIKQDEIESFYNQNKELFKVGDTRKYAVLYFDPEDYTGMVSVSDKMIEDYYNEHMNDYVADRTAKVNYVLFRTKDYAGRVLEMGVNPRRYYEQNLDKFVVPAEANVSLIFLKKPCDVNRLKSFEEALKNGVPFSELAQTYSNDPTASNGGDLGRIKRGTLKDPFDGIAFGMKSGQTSNIFETDRGYYVISVQNKTEDRVASYDEVRDDIENELLQDSVKPLALSDAKKFKNEARKQGFDPAAAKRGLTIYSTDNFKAYEKIPAIGTNTLFTTIAFTLASGEVSNEIEYDGGYAILRVSEIQPKSYLLLAEVSQNIEKKIRQENSWAFAEAAAKQAKLLIEEGVSPEAIQDRMSVHILQSDATGEAGKIIKKSDGYYIMVIAKETPAYTPDLTLISREAAALLAIDKADNIARKKAEELLAEGATTKEGVSITPPFARSDYVIDGEYMRPFIEECFLIKPEEAKIVKSLGKYYVVEVLERGVQLSGYEDASPMIKSQVLKEKRTKYFNDWLQKEREKAQIQVNI